MFAGATDIDPGKPGFTRFSAVFVVPLEGFEPPTRSLGRSGCASGSPPGTAWLQATPPRPAPQVHTGVHTTENWSLDLHYVKRLYILVT